MPGPLPRFRLTESLNNVIWLPHSTVVTKVSSCGPIIHLFPASYKQLGASLVVFFSITQQHFTFDKSPIWVCSKAANTESQNFPNKPKISLKLARFRLLPHRPEYCLNLGNFPRVSSPGVFFFAFFHNNTSPISPNFFQVLNSIPPCLVPQGAASHIIRRSFSFSRGCTNLTRIITQFSHSVLLLVVFNVQNVSEK